MPMPTTAMAAMVDTDTARGPLMPMPTTAMAAVAATDTARGPLMPMPTTAMAAMVDTDTARGPLMLMPTTATATAMAVMAMASNSTMEENHSAKRPIPFEPNSKTIRLKYCTIFP